MAGHLTVEELARQMVQMDANFGNRMAALDAEIGRLRSELQSVKAEAAEAVSKAKSGKFVNLTDFPRST